MSAEITSLQNERVKRVVKLRSGRARRELGLTVVEGEREVARAIENGWTPVEIWTCPELGGNPPRPSSLRQGFSGQGGHPSKGGDQPVVFQCSKDVFSKISYRENPDGVLAVGPLVGKTLDELELPENPLVLVAEQVEKPGNLGALLRTADGAGADAVIVCDPATDLSNPNVIRASIGTLFYLPVAEATSEEAVAWLKARGIKILSAVPDANVVYTDIDLTGAAAIVVGAEDEGLSDIWKTAADLNVKIPMRGKNDSLNVSASAAILLYEAVRQRN